MSTLVLTSCILARYVPLRTKFSASVPKTYIAKTCSSYQISLRARTATSLQGSVSLERLLHYGRAKFYLYRTCHYCSVQKSRMNRKTTDNKKLSMGQQFINGNKLMRFILPILPLGFTVFALFVIMVAYEMINLLL